LSSPQYPVFDVPPGQEPQPPDAAPVSSPRSEDPPWSGWDVLGIALLTVLAIVVFLFATTLAAQRLLFPRLPSVEVAKLPLVTVAAQFLAYLVVLVFMVLLVKRGQGRPFWSAVRWNWPRNSFVYLLGGVALAFGLQGLAHVLPMPKELPIDRFFQTANEAWALSVFGMTLAPLLEELFFRGFLYPVLVRRLGVALAVLLTAAGFGLIHAPQLGRAWAPVLVVFLVGLVLTITRAVTKSVASSLLIHIAYNGTISALIFAASDGFRHLDKLNQ
jgi:membrane protease YdiL (CAAX protease family)